MKTLVLSPEPIAPPDLRAALGGDTGQDEEILVVSPALHDSPVAFWMSDADEAIAHAQEAQSASVRNLRAQGVDAVGETGDSDPLTALEDALAGFDARRIVVFAHDEGEEAYREEGWVAEARERFGLPVHCHVIGRTERPDVPASQSALAPPDQDVRPPGPEPEPGTPHAPATERRQDAGERGGAATGAWGGAVRSVRLLLGLFLAVLGIVGLIVTLSTGSYAWLAVAVVALIASLVVVATQVVRMTGQVERQSPTTVARLEEEGIADPEAQLNERLASASTDERREMDPESELDAGGDPATDVEDQPAESRRQQGEVTPSRHSKPLR